jgi:hypothetical protein
VKGESFSHQAQMLLSLIAPDMNPRKLVTFIKNEMNKNRVEDDDNDDEDNDDDDNQVSMVLKPDIFVNNKGTKLARVFVCGPGLIFKCKLKEGSLDR